MQETMMKPYSGTAKVVDVVPAKELRFKQGLSEEELASALLVSIHVKPDDESFPVAYIDLEFSNRECRGIFAGKKQYEVSVQQATNAGLMENDDVATIFGCVGKSVNIYQKITIGQNGKEFVNTYLSSNNRISNDEAIARLKRLMGAKPPVDTSANPFA